jgi:hypothetical protein
MAFGYSISQSTDGGYVIAGNKDKSVAIYKINENGTGVKEMFSSNLRELYRVKAIPNPVKVQDAMQLINGQGLKLYSLLGVLLSGEQITAGICFYMDKNGMLGSLMIVK